MSGIATPSHYAQFSVSGAISAGIVAQPFFIAPEDLEIADVIAFLGTAPTGSTAILNLQITRVKDNSTALVYGNPGSPDVRPTFAIGSKFTVAEQNETFPAGSWPTPGPYALNDPQPGGSVATAPAYTGQSVLPINPPDANAVMFAGDLLSLDVVQIGSTVAGSNLLGAVLLLKR